MWPNKSTLKVRTFIRGKSTTVCLRDLVYPLKMLFYFPARNNVRGIPASASGSIIKIKLILIVNELYSMLPLHLIWNIEVQWLFLTTIRKFWYLFHSRQVQETKKNLIGILLKWRLVPNIYVIRSMGLYSLSIYLYIEGANIWSTQFTNKSLTRC